MLFGSLCESTLLKIEGPTCSRSSSALDSRKPFDSSRPELNLSTHSDSGVFPKAKYGENLISSNFWQTSEPMPKALARTIFASLCQLELAGELWPCALTSGI